MSEEKILIKANFTRFHIWCILFCTIGALCLPGSLVLADATGGSIKSGMFPVGFLVLLVGWILIAVGIVLSRLQYEFVVTSTKVVGKTLLGKRVDLPISQVSTIGSGIFKRITVATSSGHISFFGVTNQSEVFQAVSALLTQRHEGTQISNQPTQNQNTDSAEQLIKLKQLVEQNIITQEEFEAKKKQLLNL